MEIYPIHQLSIVIPAYNVGRTIHLILDKVKAVQLMNDIKLQLAQNQTNALRLSTSATASTTLDKSNGNVRVVTQMS